LANDFSALSALSRNFLRVPGEGRGCVTRDLVASLEAIEPAVE
jgi:hypothetical protein